MTRYDDLEKDWGREHCCQHGALKIRNPDMRHNGTSDRDDEEDGLPQCALIRVWSPDSHWSIVAGGEVPAILAPLSSYSDNTGTAPSRGELTLLQEAYPA